jgi:hypothetical protein
MLPGRQALLPWPFDLLLSAMPGNRLQVRNAALAPSDLPSNPSTGTPTLDWGSSANLTPAESWGIVSH